VHVNRAPRINPNNWVILRSLMSSLPSLTLVARMVLSVQSCGVGPKNCNQQFQRVSIIPRGCRAKSVADFEAAETAAHCRAVESRRSLHAEAAGGRQWARLRPHVLSCLGAAVVG
jgi:hypothetical protein